MGNPPPNPPQAIGPCLQHELSFDSSPLYVMWDRFNSIHSARLKFGENYLVDLIETDQ